MQNLVFFPASDALRTELFQLGLNFMLVKIEDVSQFMIVTNQLRLAQDIAIKHNIKEFYTSDSRRQIHKTSLGDKLYLDEFQVPTFYVAKLGRLTKDVEKKGKAFLVVTEDNSTYHYIVS